MSNVLVRGRLTCVETWFPGITARNKSRKGYYQAPFYVFEPAKDKVTSLTIENWPANTDRVWHGTEPVYM